MNHHTETVVRPACRVVGLYLIAAALTGCSHTSLDNLNATLWLQQSAEAEATIRQAFAVATLRLDQAINDPTWDAIAERPPGDLPLKTAIIVDVDETLLDNAAYRAWLITTKQEYSSASWNDWVQSEGAGALPGAAAFIRHAAEKNITVVYVTNRTHAQEMSTRRNLAHEGVWPVDDRDAEDLVLSKWDAKASDVMRKETALEHLHQWKSAKSPRRLYVAENYRVLLLVGDDLGDFIDVEAQTVGERAESFAEVAHRFGRDWIMIPNPTYGSWEYAAFDYDFQLPGEAKQRRKMTRLRPWSP